MTVVTMPFDVSAHLQSDGNIREFLDVMLEENGVEGFERALVYVAKAKGLADVGLQHPMPFPAIDRIIHALGLRLSVQAAA